MNKRKRKVSALRSREVQEIFEACLHRRGDTGESRVIELERAFLLSTKRLEEHRERITLLLGEVNSGFKSQGGWSLTKGNLDCFGRRWTQRPDVVEMLFALGKGIGMVRVSPIPTSILPDQKPYVCVLA